MKKRFVKLFAVVMAAVLMTAGCAFAANPFADVPAGHWAYDAVAQLAARGVVSGYPTGDFAGAQHATRYELASVVARTLAKVDAEKAGKQDLAILKKLVMEFKDELDALGVKVEKIDKRVAVLEDRVGGWKLNGSLTFDASWANSNNMYAPFRESNWFEISQGSINLTKIIDPDSYVFTRFALDRNAVRGGLRNNEVGIDRMFWQGRLSPMFTATIGRFEIDWETDAKLRHADENDSWFNSAVVDGFKFDAQFNDKFSGTAVVARNFTNDHYPYAAFNNVPLDYGIYALRLHGDFTENVWGGVTGTWLRNDNDRVLTDNIDTYGAYFGVDGWNKKAGFRAFWYGQKVNEAAANVDSPNAWKAAINLDQKLLKFTSLWVEYGETDAGFFGTQVNAYNYMDGFNSSIVPNALGMNVFDTKFLLARADQRWNDRWSSFLRYAQADFDLLNADTVKDFTIGAKYQYKPSVAFLLAYDQIDYGNMFNAFGAADDKDHIVRFRTTVSF